MRTKERMYVVIAKLTNMLKATAAITKYGPYIEKLKENGHFVAAGKWTDNSGAMLILRADSLEEVEEMVQDDPLVQNGAVAYQIKEWEANFDFEPVEY